MWDFIAAILEFIVEFFAFPLWLEKQEEKNKLKDRSKRKKKCKKNKKNESEEKTED